MEKLLTIMSMSDNPKANKELLLSYKIPVKAESQDSYINFCIKCFNGHFTMQYHPKKKWGLKCDTCNFRVGALEQAGAVHRTDEQCGECQSYKVTAQYKEDSPFPSGAKSRTACIFCDSVMRSTIVNFFFKQIKTKTPQELEEEAKVREEKAKLREEKRSKQQQDTTTLGAKPAKSAAKKKQKKNQPNILSAEDKVNEFMRKMLEKDADI